MDDLTVALNLSVAALAGLAVGIEREWSGHATGPLARFAGVRTFLLLGLIGGVVGWFAAIGMMPIAAVTLVGGIAITIAAYWRAVARPRASLDGTSEVGALTVLAIGVAAGLGHIALAGGCTAIVTLLLGEKRAIHEFVRRIEEREMHAALIFAVLALAILPVLPEGPFGPWGGVRPRLLWSVVLLFSALNFVGYVARRSVGDVRGIPFAGLVGGMMSSTAVTLDFARQSTRDPENARPLAIGVTAACTVLLVRVVVSALVLRLAVGVALAPFVALPCVLGVALVLPAIRRPAGPRPAPANPDINPLGLRSAIPMAIILQALVMGFHGLSSVMGPQAVLPTAALLGLSDVDALTFAMTESVRASGAPMIAAQGIAVGIVANTVLKMTVAAVVGTHPFARSVAWRLAAQAALVAGAVAVSLFV